MSEQTNLTDEGILKKTQGIRNQLIDALTGNGAKIPTDPDSVGLLLEVMKDADRTSLSKLKITSDDANAQQDRLAAMAMVRLGQSLGPINPFEKVVGGGSTSDDDARGTANPNLLPKIELVPGHTDIGVSSETFETFMAKMDPDLEPYQPPEKENFIPDAEEDSE